MLITQFPIAVLMQRHQPRHAWAGICWRAAAVLPQAAADGIQPDEHCYLTPGLTLDLHPDENDGYFENWVAPEPKVFVMWQMRGERAMPVVASVSYAEGARMLDSGEGADGVPMPPEIHAWLGSYLQAHYRPAPRRGRQHG